MESLEEAKRTMQSGVSVWIAPEGTRSPDGNLLPFKKGAFALAFEAGVPVVPLAIHGGPEILPKGDWRVQGGAYRITMGTPLESSAFPDAETLREAAEAGRPVALGATRAPNGAPRARLRARRRDRSGGTGSTRRWRARTARS